MARISQTPPMVLPVFVDLSCLSNRIRPRQERSHTVKTIIIQAVLLASLVSGCITPTAADARAPNTCPTAVTMSAAPNGAAPESPKEITVQTIPLDARSFQRDGEDQLSGLAWYKDHLILLPELKQLNNEGESDGYLFRIAKADIVDFLDGKSSPPIKVDRIPFFAAHVTKQFTDYQGFEAIAFKEDRVYMTFEAGRPGPDGRMRAYLVSGMVNPNPAEVRLDNELIEMPPPAQVGNASYESLMLMDDLLVSFFELNGAKIKNNDQEGPRAYAFSLSPRPSKLNSIPLPHIEYRITDATTANGDGKFWAINYYFPCEKGENSYEVAADNLADTYGKGTTHAERKQVERLVELQYAEKEGVIKLTNTPPIQLNLEDRPRNWEGLVRLDQRGFLIVTDEHPETILGFVAYP